jgi:hypothetical protein
MAIGGPQDALQALTGWLKGGHMKGITVGIFENKRIRKDSSNGGISSRCNQVTVVGIPRAELWEPTEDAPAVKLVKRTFGKKTVVHAEPIEPPPAGSVGWMSGGTFIACCDSRFGEAIGFYGAVSLHDRCETVEQYRQLSI